MRVKFIGCPAVMVDGNRLVARDNLKVSTEVCVFGILWRLRYPLECPASVAIFVEGSHDMPIGAGEERVNAAGLCLSQISDDLASGVVILHLLRFRRGVVRDAAVGIAADDEARHAM